MPALRASYALTGEAEINDDQRVLTGVHINLSDGGTDTFRARRAAALLETGFFYAASRFHKVGTDEFRQAVEAAAGRPLDRLERR